MLKSLGLNKKKKGSTLHATEKSDNTALYAECAALIKGGECYPSNSPYTPEKPLFSTWNPSFLFFSRSFRVARQVEKPKDVTGQELQRQSVVVEMIKTEAEYVADLMTICRSYMEPLKARKLISDTDFQAIFLNIEGLLGVNKLLLTDLLSCYEVHTLHLRRIGETFIRMVSCRIFFSPRLFSHRSCFRTHT
jgi:hypothetical protein